MKKRGLTSASTRQSARSKDVLASKKDTEKESWKMRSGGTERTVSIERLRTDDFQLGSISE